MARFPVSFGKRRSAAAKDDGEVVPSFRVLERTDVEGVKTFDGSSRPARPTSTVRPYSQVDSLAEEENMFTGLKVNRYVDSTARCFILRCPGAPGSVPGSASSGHAAWLCLRSAGQFPSWLPLALASYGAGVFCLRTRLTMTLAVSVR